MRTQTPPFSVQIELVEGCNLRCPFCGLQGIREDGPDKRFKFMTIETMANIATQLQNYGWNSRLELAMHGEPTMHPDYHGMVAVLRSGCTNQIMMTSNGGGLLPRPYDNIRLLFEAGLNILALDEYEGIKIVSKIRPASEGLRNIGIEVREYPADPEGNPHRRIGRRKLVSLMVDPSVSSSGTHSKLVNHCGAAFPKNERQAGKRCHRPFREMSIRWDGSVAICCNDWRGEFKVGNVLEDGIDSVWNSTRFDGARRRLIQGRRDFGPCSGCDAVSYRVGLLPDPAGKDTMEAPDEQSDAAIQEALAGDPYTVPVLRPWEK